MTLIQNEERIDQEAVKKLEEAFSIGADISAACFFANISRQTYYNWAKSFPELAERFDSLRERPVMRAYKTIAENLGKPETARWYLERKRKDEFSTKTENVVNGVMATADMSEEEFNNILEEYAKNRQREEAGDCEENL